MQLIVERPDVTETSYPIHGLNRLLVTDHHRFTRGPCHYVPLRYFDSQGIHTRHISRYAFYFAGTGLAYLAIEIALLQKFGLFLGHPNYALSVVLASLLMATGIGSLFSEVIVGALGRVRYVSYILAAIILVEYSMIFPRLPGLIGLSFSLRAAIISALILPIGVCLGLFVPCSLEQMKITAA